MQGDFKHLYLPPPPPLSPPQGDLNVLTEYEEEPSRGKAGLSKSKAMDNLSQENLVEINKEDMQTAKNGVRRGREKDYVTGREKTCRL